MFAEQVNFSGPKIVLVTFEISNLATSIWVGGWGDVASGIAKVREPPAGLGQMMLNFLS